MVIRNATEKDLPGIAEIYNDVILHGTATFDTEPKSLDDRREWLKKLSAKYVVLIAEDQESPGEVLGWASVNPWSDRKAYDGTVENSVYVREKSRGQGIGRLLLDELLSQAQANGFHTVIARIADGNPASIKLHAEAGFQEIGVMKEVGNKFNRLLDVTLMQKIFCQWRLQTTAALGAVPSR